MGMTLLDLKEAVDKLLKENPANEFMEITVFNDVGKTLKVKKVSSGKTFTGYRIVKLEV